MVKYVYLIPIEWETNFAIRLELYGCIAGGYNYLRGQDLTLIKRTGGLYGRA